MSRNLKSFGVALLTVTVLFGTPAIAAQRGDDPRDPITRIVRYLKQVFHVISYDDGITPPKP